MSIFNQPLAPGVQNQIATRELAIGGGTIISTNRGGRRRTITIPTSNFRSPAAIQYFNTRNAWIKMSSSVNVNTLNNVAASNILFGGGGRSGIIGTNPAYTPYTRTGLRPPPGITSLEVKTKSAYGSLRYATVNFQCWDIRQLEELEVLYMRPGYSVLVEWGWDPYLSNPTTLATGGPIIDIVNATPSKEQIWQRIINHSATNANYDAVYGFVQNYSWSARDDGGYDCSTTIITMGEIVESLKAPFTPGETTAIRTTRNFKNVATQVPDSDRTIGEAYTKNVIAGIATELYKAAILNYGGGGASKSWKYTDNNNGNRIYDLFVFKLPIKFNDTNTIIENDLHVYIRLDSFLQILNKYVIPEENGNPLITLSARDRAGNLLECLADKRQVSTNPTVCLIRNFNYWRNTDALGVTGVDTTFYDDFYNPSYIIESYYPALNYDVGQVGNIYLNLDFLYRLSQEGVLSSQDKKEKNDIVILDFVKSMVNAANIAIGNVANFNLFVDPQDSVTRIVDINFTGDRNAAFSTIQLQNLSSVVRKYKIESQIFPELSSIIAIGAQVQGGASSNEVNTLIDYNRGLTDRIIPAKITSNSSALTPQDKLNNTQKSFAEFLVGVFGYLGGGISPYNPDNVARLANSLRDLINLFQTYERGDATNRAILPTKLSIEMDGIGGIIIGNVFRIPNDVLPQGYSGTGANIAYVVTGIGHSIQNNDWITKIDAQFIILDGPRGAKLTPKTEKAPVPLIEAPLPTGVSSDLNKVVGPPVFRNTNPT
jgi:hypothetical protein